MTKETRANLIFLAVFLAISLPGGVILFKKKLDPAAPPMYLPEQVRRSVPYNAPADAPDLKRYVPDQTGSWVVGLAREHGYGSVLSRGGLPVMSEQRRWQVVGVRRSDKGTEVGLLLWGDMGATPPALRVASGGTVTEGRVEDRQTVAIPEGIRKELVYGGYPKPPKDVTWVSAVFPASVPSGTVLQLSSPEGGVDSVTLFTE